MNQLTRTTFVTSRLLDFARRRSCRRRPATRSADWPLVIVKEARRQRARRLRGRRHRARSDGPRRRRRHHDRRQRSRHPGEDDQVGPRLLVRVSSREAYVVADARRPGQRAEDAGGDAVRAVGRRAAASSRSRPRACCTTSTSPSTRSGRQPAIGYRTEPADRKNGTEITVRWPDLACSILDDATPRFLQIAEDYCLAQPAPDAVRGLVRRVVDVDGDGARPGRNGSRRIRPRRTGIRRSAAAADRRLCRRRCRQAAIAPSASSSRSSAGFPRTAKQKAVLEALGLSRAPLSALVSDGAIDARPAARLFDAMRAQSKPVKPKLLGAIGRDHFERAAARSAARWSPSTIARSRTRTTTASPTSSRPLSAWRGEGCSRRARHGHGVNWSPGITNPFRVLGGYGAEPRLDPRSASVSAATSR